MEHMIQLETPAWDSLYLASYVFQDVNETLQSVHAVVAALLHYAELGASIANSLVEWSTYGGQGNLEVEAVA